MDATTLRDPAVVEKLEEYFPIQVLADFPNKPPRPRSPRPLRRPGLPDLPPYPQDEMKN